MNIAKIYILRYKVIWVRVDEWLKSIPPVAGLNRRTSLKMFRRGGSNPSLTAMALNSQGFFNNVFVYIIRLRETPSILLWQSNNINFRLGQHNNGETWSNKHSIPRTLIGFLKVSTRSKAESTQ